MPAAINDTLTPLMAKASWNPKNHAALSALWRAVFQREHWYFLPAMLGLPEEERSLESPAMRSPLAARIEGKLFVLAFTSQERALDAAQRNNLVDERFGAPVIQIPRDNAVVMLSRAASDELKSVMFNRNEGEYGFHTLLTNLAVMFEFELDRLPAVLWDDFVRGVVGAQSQQGWARLHRRLNLLDQWYIPVTAQGQAAVIKHGEDPHVIIFTDPERAKAGVEQLGGALDQQIRLAAQPPAAAAAALAKLSDGAAAVKHAIFNIGSQPFITPLEQLKGPSTA